MHDTQRGGSLKRFVLETAAVLSGILIAFGLDAGWGAFRERAELRESLSLLRDEFAAARVQMDTVLAVNERAMNAMVELLETTPDDLADLSPEEAGRLWQPLQRSESFDPGESAISAVVSSNIFERMDSRELRRLVSGWTGQVADLREEQEEAYRVEARIRDLLATEGLWGGPVGNTRPYQELYAEWVQIEEVRQLFMLRTRAVALALREQRPLSESLDDILDLLDVALTES